MSTLCIIKYSFELNSICTEVYTDLYKSKERFSFAHHILLDHMLQLFNNHVKM